MKKFLKSLVALQFHVGLYAAVLAGIGFGFFPDQERPLIMMVLACATSFWLAVYVALHSYPTRTYEGFVIAVASCTGISLMPFSSPLAEFFAIGMLLGIMGTFTQRWFFFNNFLAALCATMPVFTGVVYHGEMNPNARALAALLFILVFAYQILCDIENRAMTVAAGVSCKLTIPKIFGNGVAMVTVSVLLMGSGVLTWCWREHFNVIELIVCSLVGILGIISTLGDILAREKDVDIHKLFVAQFQWLIRLALAMIILSSALL